MKHRRKLPFLAAAALVAASSLNAAALTWDITSGDGATITGGTGNWADGAGNWNTGSGDTTWSNANPDSATFGGTAGTVTLTGPITTGGLTFNTAGYIVTGSTLTFAGATPGITANTNATIASAINTGGLTLTKSGAGTLTLNGNTFTGGGVFDITAGQVTTNGTVALGTTNLKVENGRALVIALGSGITGGTITLGSGSQFGFQNGGAGQVTTTSNIVLNAGSGAANAAQIGGFIFGNNTTLSGSISGTGDLRWMNNILGGGSNQANLTAGSSTTGWAANSYTGATSFEGVNLNFNLNSTVNNATITPFGATTNAVTANGGATLHFTTTGSANNTSIIANAMSLSAANGQTTTLFREDGNLRVTGDIDIATTGTGKVVFQSKWGQVTNKGLNIEGVLSGGGNLSISRGNDGSEDGAVHLTNNGNTFNGTISVDSTGGNAGRLVLDANGAATNAGLNLAVSGAELNVNTANATIASLSGVAGSKISARTAGQTLTVNQSVDTTFAGVVGGTGLQNTAGNAAINLVKTGSGTLTLSGANLHTGTTTVNGGRLNLTSTNVSAITVNSGATLGGTGSTTGLLTMNGGSLLALAGGAATTAFTSNGVNFAGATQVTFDSALIASTVYDVLNYGTGTVTNAGNLTAAARGTLAQDLVNNKFTFTAGSVATRTWNTTSGTWDNYTTANFAEGDFKFSAGDTVVFNDPASASTVTLNGTLAPASVSVTNTNAYTFAGTGAIAGASTTLTKAGAGTLILATNNTYGGGTTISAGTLQVGNAGTTGSLGSGAVVNNGILAFNRTDSTTIANTISGTGAVQVNSGTVVFNNQKTYTGGTTINSGATLNLAGGGGSSGAIRGTATINSGGTLILSGGDATGYSGGASALNTININGGTLNVTTTGGSGANQTFGGTTVTLTGGTLTGIAGSTLDLFGNASSINSAASGTTSTVSGVSIGLRQNNSTFTVGQGTTGSGIDLSISSVVTNASPGNSEGNHLLIKAGAGTLALTGANTYTGGTTINAGRIITGNISALGSGAGAVTVNAGILQIGDGTVHTVTLGAGANLVIASGATLKIDSATSAIALTGAGGFTIGSGALIDLGGVFDGLGSTTTYNLITGGSGTKTAGAQVTGYNTSVFSSVTFDNAGTLTFTAVPEPSTYGLLGAGALAAAALVRRRKKMLKN